MTEIAILVLAAGASSRMRGADKLLEKVAQQSLLRRQALRAGALGVPVYVTIPPNRPDRKAVLTGLDVQLVDVKDAEEGMGASIRAAISALPRNIDAIMILPADMPEIDTEDMRKIADAFDEEAGCVVRATSETGEAGHPVLFPKRLFRALLNLNGDQGARVALRGEDITFVPLPGQRALVDLDTPKDWHEWRAQH